MKLFLWGICSFSEQDYILHISIRSLMQMFLLNVVIASKFFYEKGSSVSDQIRIHIFYGWIWLILGGIEDNVLLKDRQVSKNAQKTLVYSVNYTSNSDNVKIKYSVLLHLTFTSDMKSKSYQVNVWRFLLFFRLIEVIFWYYVSWVFLKRSTYRDILSLTSVWYVTGHTKSEI